jgi:hypothetical protein
MRHYEEAIILKASQREVFTFVDDHRNFSSHMNKSSWMMGGGKFTTEIDKDNFQKVGSHIKMKGTILGIQLYLDEVVSERSIPYSKQWETMGAPRLLVIGSYIMAFEVKPDGERSKFTVSIDYVLPKGFFSSVLGLLFGAVYAQWCVRQMISGVRAHVK